MAVRPDQFSDSELEDASKITDPASCLDYLKRREVFLYKMMNDPSHKAMLYFLEVLMNADSPLSVEQLAARFTNKAFSEEMREACGGGSVEALREFLHKYPSLFTVKPNDQVSAVAIDMPGFDEMSEGSIDVDIVAGKPGPQRHTSVSSSVAAEKSENNNQPTLATQPLKSSLKNSANCAITANSEVKPVGIYQPPILRAQAAAAASTATMARQPSFCEMCSMAAHVATTAATTTVVHCPFAGIHHCNHQHQNYHRHSQPTLKHTRSTGHCCCGESTSSTSYYRGPGTPKMPPCSYMENFALETEAVKFFQQRLGRREERWVPIKSLAGHLSQASMEVRSIVGPQLEFRRFLLKHPHVFEVQGDLVGLKNPFTAACLSSSSSSALNSRPKSFVGSSHSTASLSALNPRGTPKVARPKSLVMLSQTSVPLGPIRRLESIPTGSENILAGGCDLESLAISSPNTAPIRSSGSRPRTNGANRFSAAQQDTVTSSVRRGNRGQEVDINSSSSGSICIRMSANEYRAIMFLRKVLAKKGGAPGQLGLSYVQLMQILSAKAPETVQSAIGWTKVELEEFILQHPIFFEIHDCSDLVAAQQSSLPVSSVTWALGEGGERPSTLVTNRRVLKMINIVITGNKPLDAGTRTMTNRSGRVFHVAKLWGIIDLGKHEHVFFDKSILKYVDDLQKHFKVDEVLYFNAILAPKESRAKWRATQVWKECDKEIMEKFGGAAFSSRSAAGPVPSSSGPAPGKNSDSVSSDDFGLVDEEEVEEEVGAASAIARAEGLNLANDIKFLSDEVEEELERILGPNKAVATTITTTTTTNFNTNTNNNPIGRGKSALGYVSDEDTSITGCIEDISVNFSDVGSLSENEGVRVQKTQRKSVADSSMSERLSIAVQTLSTGDIMATQIFHDIT